MVKLLVTKQQVTWSMSTWKKPNSSRDLIPNLLTEMEHMPNWLFKKLYLQNRYEYAEAPEDFVFEQYEKIKRDMEREERVRRGQVELNNMESEKEVEDELVGDEIFDMKIFQKRAEQVVKKNKYLRRIPKNRMINWFEKSEVKNAKWYVGLKGCFHFLRVALKSKLKVEPNSESDWSARAAANSCLSVSMSSKTVSFFPQTVKQDDLSARVQHLHEVLELSLYAWTNRKFQKNRRRKVQEDPAHMQHRDFRSKFEFELRMTRGVRIFHFKKSKEVIVMDQNMLESSVNLLKMFWMSLQYLKSESKFELRHDLVPKFLEYWKKVLKAESKMSRMESQHLCRILKLTHEAELADMFGPMNREQRDFLLKEAQSEVPRTKDLPIQILNALQGLPFRFKHLILRQYKMFPCPEHSPFDMLMKQSLKHENENPRRDYKDASFGDFLLFCKFELMKLFRKRHGRWPGEVLEGAPEKFKYGIPEEGLNHKDTEWIKLNGDFQFKGTKADLFSMYKDKTTCNEEQYKEEKILGRNEKDQNSHLLHFLQMRNPKDASEYEEELKRRQHGKGMPVAVTTKPEGHKPISRSIYMADSYTRIVLQSFENSISIYMKYMNGYSLGMNPADLQRQMESCSVMSSKKNNLYRIFFSFDLESFSGGMRRDLKFEMYKLFSEAFGYSDPDTLMNINTGVRLIYNREGEEMSVMTPAADFEGWNGKMNTFVHVCLMKYTCSQLAKRKLIENPSRFMCFIDDGMLSAQVPHSRRVNPIMQSVLLKNEIIKYYKVIGFVVHPKKTHISNRGYTYLSRIFLDTNEVHDPVTPLSKVWNQPTTAISTLVEDIEASNTGCRSAVEKGAPVMRTMYFLIFVSLQKMKSWARKDHFKTLDDSLLNSMFATPELKGLGVSVPSQLISNVDESKLQAYLGFVRYMMREWKGFHSVAMQHFQRWSIDYDIISTPSQKTVKFKKTLKGDVLKREIRRSLPGKIRNVAVQLVLSLSEKETELAHIAYQEGNFEFVPAVSKLLYEASPRSMVDSLLSKFQRSRTLYYLLGPKRRRFAMMKIRGQANRFLKSFF